MAHLTLQEIRDSINLTDYEYKALCRMVASAWHKSGDMPSRSMADRFERRRAFHNACDDVLVEWKDRIERESR